MTSEDRLRISQEMAKKIYTDYHYGQAKFERAEIVIARFNTAKL
jgi:hypothetical protein